MMRLFARLAGGRKFNSRTLPCRDAGASGLPPAIYFSELMDAIDAATVTRREPNDDGERIMVACHALRGAFIYSREEAARRIDMAYPFIGDAYRKRALRHLESRVRIAACPPTVIQRSAWVHGWRE